MIHTRQQLRRIAVIKPCCIGDCVMALPSLDAVLAAFPQAEIDLYVGDHSRAVFEDWNGRERLVRVDETFTLRRTARLAWRLHRVRYDAVIVLDRSRWLRLAGRLGTRDVVATPSSRSPELRHESEVYLDVLRSIGIEAPSTIPSLDTATDATNSASTRTSRYVVLHPGGGCNPGSLMPEKRWAEASWIALGSELVRRGYSIVLTGGASDRDAAQRIASTLDGKATVAAGTSSLAETIATVRDASLFVGPDTGVTHVAAACGIPTVAVFGPTNPNRYRPLGLHVEVCAAPGSWTLVDRDLRMPGLVPADANVDMVPVSAVIAACERLLERVP